MGLGLYPVEDISAKALQGVGQAGNTYGKMMKKEEVKTTPPGSSIGGAIGAGVGMGMAGAAVGSAIPGVGTMIGGAGGFLAGAASYLLS